MHSQSSSEVVWSRAMIPVKTPQRLVAKRIRTVVGHIGPGPLRFGGRDRRIE